MSMTITTLKNFAYSTKWNAVVLGVLVSILFAWRNNDWSMQMLDRILLIISVGIGGRAIVDGMQKR